MNDQELRQMIRESIARLGAGPGVSQLQDVRPSGDAIAGHTSFARLPLRSGDDDGACVIEPTVRCNHCGYCLSYGH